MEKLPPPSRLPLLRSLLVGSILVPATLLAIGAWYDHGRLHREAEKRALHTAGILHEHAQKSLKDHELVLKMAERRLRGMDWDAIRTSKVLWDDLSGLIQTVEQVNAIVILDPTGVTALTTRV